jgi:hypothetical protein
MAVKKTKKGVKKIGKKVSNRKSDDLTIHFMPYSEILREDAIGRIKKIMGLVLDNKIIILQGKLKPDEEVRLIENSMTLIGNIRGFQGVEIATISGEDGQGSLFHKVRRNIAKILVGEQDIITIIGPATIVKEMKKNPSKIELLLQRR